MKKLWFTVLLLAALTPTPTFARDWDHWRYVRRRHYDCYNCYYGRPYVFYPYGYYDRYRPYWYGYYSYTPYWYWHEYWR